jgi:hypothetical protein
VNVKDIVVPIAPGDGFNLTEFGTKNPPIDQPIKKNLDFYAKVRRRLKRAMITKNSPITKEIRNYYETIKDDLRDYSAFWEESFSEDPDGLIEENGLPFNSLSQDQLVSLGLYMVKNGKMKWNE